MYERTFPLKFNKDKEDKPLITQIKSNPYDKDDGIIFITVWTGRGTSLGNFAKDLTVVRDKEYGILNADILHNGKNLHDMFYNHDGKKLDEFMIKNRLSLCNYIRLD